MDNKYRGFPAIYKSYMKSDKIKGNKIKDYKLAKKVMESIMMTAWKKMIEESAVFRLPHGMGSFMIVERKTKEGKISWYIDWKESKDKGEIVKKPNLHSGGIKHGCYWDSTLCHFAGKSAYRFKFVRGDKDERYGYRYINKWIEICNKDPDKGIYRSNIR